MSALSVKNEVDAGLEAEVGVEEDQELRVPQLYPKPNTKIVDISGNNK